GGGVGGLTLAYALAKCQDVRVDVYEAATRFAEIGAGVGLFWRTQRILTALGLRDAVTALGSQFNDGYVPAFECRKSDQSEGVFIDTMLIKGGLTAVHRAEFHTILINSLSTVPNVGMHTSKRLVSYTQPVDPSAPVELTFADGSSATCDVLIGADGLKSVVRALMMEEMAKKAKREEDAKAFRDCIRARFSGMLVYRAILPSDRLAAINPGHKALRGPLQYLGKNKHIVAYPISKGRFVNVAAFEVHFEDEGIVFPDPWVSKVDARKVAKMFDGWEKEVTDIMSVMSMQEVSRWVVNIVKPLPTYAYGRVAAHAMCPLQGAGAGQAIEDAAVLSAVLSYPGATIKTASKALESYSCIRLPSAKLVTDVSRENSYNSALSVSGKPEISLSDLALRMQKCWEISHGRDDPLKDARRAVNLFGKALTSTS
ncbi:hypothetical protein K488DRAFT_48695, partial [Vararia minispora EC-137]